MPVLTTAPMVGAADRTVSGRVEVTPTESFTYGGEVVGVRMGIIRDGLIFDAAGTGPLLLAPTPPGAGVRIALHLFGVDGETTTIARTVQLPDVAQVYWAYLDDLMPADVPVDPGAEVGFGLGPFGLDSFGT